MPLQACWNLILAVTQVIGEVHSRKVASPSQGRIGTDKPFAPMGNLESPVNLTACLLTVEGYWST